MKLPIQLQGPAGVICDVLSEFPPEDQSRTLEAVRVLLGLKPLAVQVMPEDRNPYRAEREALPMVEIQMVGAQPMVTNGAAGAPPQVPQAPARMVLIGADRPYISRRPFGPRQLRAPADAQQAGGFVRQVPAVRDPQQTGGFVRSLR